MVELLTDYTTQIYHALSTDARPAADPGAQLREIDTGKRYIFDGNSWNELAAGGTTPTLITKTITENGTYAASSDNADGYSSVTVDVAASGYTANDWTDPAKPTGKLVVDTVMNSNALAYQYLLCSRTGITELEFTRATGLPEGYAKMASNVVKVTGPYLENINVESLSGLGVEYLILPKLFTNSRSALGSNTKLVGVDFGMNSTVAGHWYNNLFNGCTKLTVIVLRHPVVNILDHINVFTGTPFASGKSGGTLYVPSALIADYQAATNWSTILGYTNNQILPIEGSIYETQYVDGTPIS